MAQPLPRWPRWRCRCAGAPQQGTWQLAQPATGMRVLPYRSPTDAQLSLAAACVPSRAMSGQLVDVQGAHTPSCTWSWGCLLLGRAHCSRPELCGTKMAWCRRASAPCLACCCLQAVSSLNSQALKRPGSLAAARALLPAAGWYMQQQHADLGLTASISAGQEGAQTKAVRGQPVVACSLNGCHHKEPWTCLLWRLWREEAGKGATPVPTSGWPAAARSLGSAGVCSLCCRETRTSPPCCGGSLKLGLTERIPSSLMGRHC